MVGTWGAQIRLQWKTGVAATDWDNIAKRTKVDAMAMSLRELESEIKEIHEVGPPSFSPAPRLSRELPFAALCEAPASARG